MNSSCHVLHYKPPAARPSTAPAATTTTAAGEQSLQQLQQQPALGAPSVSGASSRPATLHHGPQMTGSSSIRTSATAVSGTSNNGARNNAATSTVPSASKNDHLQPQQQQRVSTAGTGPGSGPRITVPSFSGSSNALWRPAGSSSSSSHSNSLAATASTSASVSAPKRRVSFLEDDAQAQAPPPNKRTTHPTGVDSDSDSDSELHSIPATLTAKVPRKVGSEKKERGGDKEPEGAKRRGGEKHRGQPEITKRAPSAGKGQIEKKDCKIKQWRAVGKAPGAGGKDGDGYEALERKHWELYNQPQSAREWVDSRHEREEGLVLLHQSFVKYCFDSQAEGVLMVLYKARLPSSSSQSRGDSFEDFIYLTPGLRGIRDSSPALPWGGPPQQFTFDDKHALEEHGVQIKKHAMRAADTIRKAEKERFSQHRKLMTKERETALAVSIALAKHDASRKKMECLRARTDAEKRNEKVRQHNMQIRTMLSRFEAQGRTVRFEERQALLWKEEELPSLDSDVDEDDNDQSEQDADATLVGDSLV